MFTMQKKYLGFFVLFVFVFAVSYFYFVDQYTTGVLGYFKDRFSPNSSEKASLNEPKTEACPLNGALYGKSQKEVWQSRRPLGIMVENSVDARPQSGLSSADVVFEAVAEGGITRFLAIYYCQDAETIGPVRSARVYFLDFIGGFGNNPLYAHVGGANTPGPADALGQIEKAGWAGYNDLNQFSIGYPAFWRDYERLPGVAVEHTMYTSSEKLWQIAAKRGLEDKNKKGKSWDENYRGWDFEEEASLSKRPEKQEVRFGFWENYHDFDVLWAYDKSSNEYKRHNGGSPHVDKATGEPIKVKNVIVLYMDESVANDGYEKGQHLLYETTGEGKALVFKNGQVVEASWEKKDRASQVFLSDKQGRPIKFVGGKIWFSVIPSDNQVRY
jgi:hypothetical protein